MYAEHVPVIANAMRGDAETFLRGCLFAVCSIRQPVVNVPSQLDDIDQHRGASDYLFGHKRQAYAYLLAHRDELWRDICALPIEASAEAIMRLCDVPGLGVVKAAFVCQMLGFDVACLDTRNIVREGRSPRAYRVRKECASKAAWRRVIDRYVADVGGKAQYYWDTWCAEVGEIYHLTGKQMSALHADTIAGEAIPF